MQFETNALFTRDIHITMNGDTATVEYMTPEWLATQISHQVHIQAGHSILEPAAGSGALIRPFGDLLRHGSIRAVCYEVQPELAKKIPEWRGIELLVRSFLTVYPILRTRTIDHVIMNPPFIAPGYTEPVDLMFFNRALEFLKIGGDVHAILSIESANMLWRDDDAREGFEEFKIETLPAETFALDGIPDSVVRAAYVCGRRYKGK